MKRFNVRFGEELEGPAVVAVPRSDKELLERALALLQELRDADFMPAEFHLEHDALVKARHG